MGLELACRHCGSTACARRYLSKAIILNCAICGLATCVYRPAHRPPVQRVIPRGPTILQLPLDIDVSRETRRVA
jgi:uncharacterized protein (DUF983 family)